jgi:hypothetical protein
MSIVARELDYKKKDFSHGSYMMTKVIQQTGGESVTITTGGNESIFELPPKVFNLSKSVLAYVSTPIATAGFNLYFSDVISEIRQIQLYTTGGLFLADINYADNYTKSILRHETPLTEIQTNHTILVGGSTSAPIAGYVAGAWEGLHNMEMQISEVAAAGVPTILSQLCPEVGGSAYTLNYNTPAYFIGGNTASATPVMTKQIPLRLYKNSIFELDKDLYFGGESIYMRIIWNNSNRIYYGAATLANATTTEVTGTGVTITDLNLFLAVENDKIAEQSVKNSFNSSVSLNLPYVYSNMINIASTNGGNNSITMRYNKGHGSKLLKIYWSPYNGAASTIRTSYDHINCTAVASPVAGSRVSSFYTTVNSERTSQFNYDCTKLQDYLVKKNKLRGSGITSSTDYYVNFTWIEDFTDNYALYEKPLDGDQLTYIDGKKLDEEIVYNIFATFGAGVPANLNHYIFAVTQKTLTVNSNGITLQ